MRGQHHIFAVTITANKPRPTCRHLGKRKGPSQETTDPVVAGPVVIEPQPSAQAQPPNRTPQPSTQAETANRAARHSSTPRVDNGYARASSSGVANISTELSTVEGRPSACWIACVQSVLDHASAPGNARITTHDPRGNWSTSGAIPCRKRRLTRLRTTEFPTGFPTASPTCGQCCPPVIHRVSWAHGRRKRSP